MFRNKSLTIDKNGGVESFGSQLRQICWNQLILYVAGQKDRPDIESHGGGMMLLLRPFKKSAQLGNVEKTVVVKTNIYVLRKLPKELYTMLRVAEQVRFGEVLRREDIIIIIVLRPFLC